MNQVISFERVIYYGYIQESRKDPAVMDGLDVKRRPAPNIAFGTRVPSMLPAVVTNKGSPTRRSEEYGGMSALHQSLAHRDVGLTPNPYDEHYDKVQSTIKKLQ